MTTEDLMKLADKFAFFMPGSEEGEKARQALLDAIEAQAREIEQLESAVERWKASVDDALDQRDAVRTSFDELASAVGWTREQCEQAGDSPIDVANTLRAELAAIRATQEPARYQEIREALENLMAWQVKNVKVWNHPTWDNAQAVIDRHAASPKIGGV